MLIARLTGCNACWLLVLATCAVIGGVSAPAYAMGVTPIHIEMTSTGAGGRAQVTVSNDGTSPLPVEASIQSLALEENGEQKLSTAGDEFLLFPPQALIPAGRSQVFRLQWVGEPLLQSSQSYLLSLSQIPVQLPKGSSAVQIVMSFGVFVNVAPPQGQAQLRIAGTGIATDRQGKRRPIITVENPSRVHGLLPQSTIYLSAGSWSRTVTEAELRDKIGIGLVQPGKRRKFILPVDLPANVSSLQASIEYKPKRQ
ncbi:MAG: fimbria/pilus periplasmic chaperone [Rhodospirillales bacterium]|nr:fimbria/pilus periplasmic chaperone [Rhodospirillales bacterium]